MLQDNYESQAFSPVIGGNDVELKQLADIFKVSVSDFITHAKSLASPDELSVYIARQLMKRLAPSLLWITLHDIDVAHSGAFSLYLEGIRRSDRLCAELWKTIQSEPEYAGKTTLFILPDFGRDSDVSSGGNGFQHHRTGDPTSRTTWMMVLGPGIRENHIVERAVDSTDLVPTLGLLLGFTPTFVMGTRCWRCSEMQPSQLTEDSFKAYPPKGRALAVSQFAVAAKTAAGVCAVFVERHSGS